MIQLCVCICVYIYTHPGEGNGSPVQYSCLGNPVDRGAWWAAVKVEVLVAQSCLTLCDLMDYSPQGSSVHRIQGGKKQILSHFTETYIPVGLLRGKCKGRSGDLH